MRRLTLSVCACVALLPLSSPAGAQVFGRLSNPQFKVPLVHPPQIALKGVQKIAVREFSGDCGLELSERLMHTVAATGKFEMIDRSHLEGVLQEQGLHTAGAVSLDSALKVGRLLGPSAMFAGRVTRCTIETTQPLIVPGEHRDLRGAPAIKYARRTTAQMTASVVLIDFTTGKTHTGKLIEARAERTNELLNAVPEAPNRDVVQTEMYQDAIRQVRRIIEPWTETVEITVFDDDDANRFRLKPSTEQMKRGDFAGAVIALEGLMKQGGGARVTEKDVAKLNYNLGIGYMYSGRVFDAVPILQKALSLDARNSIIQEGLQTAERMATLERERARIEATAVQFGAETSAKPAPAAPPQSNQPPAAAATKPATKPTLNNAEILQMLRDKMPELVILSRIKNEPAAFDVSAAALATLKKAGASNELLLAIVNKK